MSTLYTEDYASLPHHLTLAQGRTQEARAAEWVEAAGLRGQEFWHYYFGQNTSGSPEED